MADGPGPEPRSSFEQQAARKRQGLIGEYFQFLRQHRKWYLIPIVIALILLGALIFVAGTSVAPFIYTMF
jgi:hypothetical protein